MSLVLKVLELLESIEINGIDVTKSFKKAEDFLKKITSKIDSVPTPKIIKGSTKINQFMRPSLRGSLLHNSNTIVIYGDYPFDNVDLVERTIRHEISEWIEFVITGVKVNRREISHDTPLFKQIQKIVKKSYPLNPNRISDLILKEKS